MKKIILILINVLLSTFAFGQNLTLSLVEQTTSGGCGSPTDCSAGIISYDIVLTSDTAGTFYGYNLNLTYDPSIISIENGGSDTACLLNQVTPNELEALYPLNPQYSANGSNLAGVAIAANTPTVIHNVTFSVIDDTALDGAQICVGGNAADGHIIDSPMTFKPSGGLSMTFYMPLTCLTLSSSTLSCLVSDPPVLTDDTGTYTSGTPTTLDIVSNDTTGATVDATTVSLIAPTGGSCTSTDADGDCIEVTVTGEGVWTVDETTGAVTFTPESGFTGDPTPITYTADSTDGIAAENPATITITTSSTCTDSDGDGVCDDDDIDDDNDGILDTAECTPPTATTTTCTTYWANIGNEDGNADDGESSVYQIGTSDVTVTFNEGGVNGGTINNTYSGTLYQGYTMIAANRTTVDANGSNLSQYIYQSLHFSEPVVVGDLFEMTDVDASEIMAIVGFYNGNVVLPTYSNMGSNTTLVTQTVVNQPSLGDTLPSTLQMVKSISTGNVDYGAAVGNATADFGDQPLDAVYMIYGITTTVAAGTQTSGFLPPCFDYVVTAESYCDYDGDGIPNQLDLDSDNDGCPDALEGGASIESSQLVTSTMDGGNTTATSGTYFEEVTSNLCADATCVNSDGLPQLTTPSDYDNSTGQTIGDSQDPTVNSCVCYNSPSPATGLDTNHGITLLQRAGGNESGDVSTSDDWPMVRKSGHTALESNTKGFVITRMSSTQIEAIEVPVDGMMVYDTTIGCLKIYTVDDNDSTSSTWECYSTQTCP